MTSFRNLNVYTKSKELVKQIYELLKKFPREEQFALSDQLRRAVISIPSNIAEGSGRNSQKDQAHFYNIAYGSLMEVFSQLDIACDLGYISQEEFNQLESLINEEAKMLSGLIAKRKQPIAQRPLNKSVTS
jgi:four helix bundle protein